MRRMDFSNKNPFQIALILMLIVLIPYLIFMITVYIVSAKKSEDNCKDFCGIQKRSIIFRKSTKIFLNGSSVKPSPKDIGKFIKGDTQSTPSYKKLNQNKEFLLKYKDKEMCPADLKETIPYPYIASIIQTLYVDYNGNLDQKYICSGGIISENWVISSSECMGLELFNFDMLKVLYLRVGSSYWSKNGVLHEIKQIIHPPVRETQLAVNPTVIAIKSKHPFLKSQAIRFLKIPTMSMFHEREEGYIYSFYADENIVFHHRKKNQKITPSLVEIFKEGNCELTKNRRSVFCGIEMNMIDFCDTSKGGPIIKNDYLIGVHISSSCSQDKNEHYFTDIVHYYKWLRIFTKFHETA